MFYLMKSRISGMGSAKGKMRFWIRLNKSAQKNYNRFSQDLIESLKVSKRGYHGYTEILGRGFDINVFKNENYIHFILYSDGKTRNKIMKILLNYFDLPK